MIFFTNLIFLLQALFWYPVNRIYKFLTNMCFSYGKAFYDILCAEHNNSLGFWEGVTSQQTYYVTPTSSDILLSDMCLKHIDFDSWECFSFWSVKYVQSLHMTHLCNLWNIFDPYIWPTYLSNIWHVFNFLWCYHFFTIILENTQDARFKRVS